jgi:hypothetical protein
MLGWPKEKLAALMAKLKSDDYTRDCTELELLSDIVS